MSENKVTLEGINEKIKDECFIVLPDGRTTVCMLTLENGYTIKGMSACVDVNNFEIGAGRKFAYEDALRQIWPLEGYLLAQRMYENPFKTPTVSSVLEEAKNQLEAEIEKWSARATNKKIVAKRGNRPIVLAPYGFKKDGTPKKAPGRPKAQA